MGTDTYGPGDDRPQGGLGPESDNFADVSVALGSPDDPERPADRESNGAHAVEPAAEEKPREPAESADSAGPAPATPPVEDVRPRRPREESEGSVGKQLREGWKRVVNAVATAVIIVSVVIAIFLALHIVFVVFEANKDNGIVEFINGWATDLAYGFKDLFVPKDPSIRVTVNYALAAVVYLVVGRILAGVIRRLG